MPDISVILPARDEAEALPQLLEELRETLDNLGRPYEIIVVDDGSRDGTSQFLEEVSADWPELVGIVLRSNVGQTAALQAGFDRAGGEVVVTLDADGQNDPRDIPLLLEKLDEGFDVVSGWRVDRQDSGFSRRLPSKIANWLVRICSGSRLNDQGCALKAYRAEILREIRIYGDQHRYIAVLAEGKGASVGEIPVRHRARSKGQSHYGWGRIPRVLLDLLFLKYIVSYSHRPLHLFGGAGLLSFLTGFVAATCVTYDKFICYEPAADRPLLLLSVLLMLMGVVLVSLGILAELLVRSYHEVTGDPSYRIRRVIGGDL